MFKLGLLGHNINYSLSGKIHEFALRSFGWAGTYDLVHLEADQVHSFLESAWQQGFQGFNVTTPYKTLIAQSFAECGLSSVNTLVRCEQNPYWKAYSTDGVGFTRALARIGCQISRFERVVILGSGGVLPSLLSCLGPATDVHIVRRSASRDAMLSQLRPSLSFWGWNLESVETLFRGAGPETLVIQASSAPTRGDELRCFASAIDDFAGVFVDLVYRTPSCLYFLARKKNLNCQEGLPMLIEQARASQELWFGQSVDFESLWDYLKEFQS